MLSGFALTNGGDGWVGGSVVGGDSKNKAKGVGMDWGMGGCLGGRASLG